MKLRKEWKNKKITEKKERIKIKIMLYTIFFPRAEDLKASMISKLGMSELFVLVSWGRGLLH